MFQAQIALSILNAVEVLLLAFCEVSESDVLCTVEQVEVFFFNEILWQALL